MSRNTETTPTVKIAFPADRKGEPFADALAGLKTRLDQTPRHDFPARLDALNALSDSLLSPGSVASTAVAGSAFLAGFLRRENLEQLVKREVPCVDALTGFARIAERKSLRILPKGVVCHWVAGNVPLLGVFSWAIGALVGNVNVIRLSSSQDDFVTPLLARLAGLSDAAKQMAEDTLVVSFARDDRDSHEQMSRAANVRIGWGGREAVETIRSLPCRWECEDVVFGPRVSLAVVDPALMTEGLTSRLAADIVYFDQMACSSPQHVYVKGTAGRREFDAFLERFTAAFARAAESFPRHRLDFSETYQIHLDRTRAVLAGGSIQRDTGTQWTAVVVDEPRPEIVGANRFIQVIPFESFNKIYPKIPKNVQTVLTVLSESDAAEFTEKAARCGVRRFPRPGEGNNFENPWDGVPLVSRLANWVTRTDARG